MISWVEKESSSSSLDIQSYSNHDERRSIDKHQVREQEPGRGSRKDMYTGVDGQRSVESLEIAICSRRRIVLANIAVHI